ncbi:CRISPR-associated primase-polymerase type A1 [Desulfobulbus elongatus]|uniref:CRISPR-associated primase-polymerase type A1 n=1 Tax=Desulfobulbus elongatus TaxID=53332 RepID=UPI0006850DE5|nr:CRISPR-associated primase-polymerase type A1 [Desulfobulbus elongatus]
MAQRQSISEPQAVPNRDHRLLLDRICKAGFDEAGRAFVVRAFASGVFWADFSDEEVMELAVVAQQHGLFDEGVAILDWLNRERPRYADGWRAHAELLDILGKRKEAARVAAQARRFLPAEITTSWQPASSVFVPSAGEDERFLEPFVQLRRQDEETQGYMTLFRGREDTFARQWANREEGKQGYVPVQRPMQPEDVREHLQGRKTYGIYLLTGESRVWTGVIDVDLAIGLRDRRAAEKEKAAIRRESVYLYTRLLEMAGNAGLTCIAEVSGGKGYHFWFPLAQPVAAADMRNGLKTLIGSLANDLRCFTLEIFPKQDHLTGKGFGNLVKLPLGIHRVTGKKSYFVGARGQATADQLSWLRTQRPAAAEKILTLAERHRTANVMVHPKLAAWASQYPELAELEAKCAMLGQLIAMARSAKELSVREEKILLGTVGHLERGRLLLHHLFSRMPEYNRPLLDFKISKIRGTPLGCKRIHSLMDQAGGGELPCGFDRSGYPHPLLHLEKYRQQPAMQEKVVDLKDALVSLKTAIVQVERFL